MLRTLRCCVLRRLQVCDEPRAEFVQLIVSCLEVSDDPHPSDFAGILSLASRRMTSLLTQALQE
jgi:hypothetical protein